MPSKGPRPRLVMAIAVALAASCSTAGTRPDFSGSWAYIKRCDRGHAVNLTIKQVGKQATGDWSEGTELRGGDGELKGVVRAGKLFVRYCATDGEAAMSSCPAYEEDEDYFELRGDTLVRFQKYGSGYKEDVVLHRDDSGREVPVDTNCYDEEHAR